MSQQPGSPIGSSPASGLDRHPHLPPGLTLAAAWAWRLGVIVLAALGLVWLLAKISSVVIPVMVAVLLSALLVPFVAFLVRHRWPRSLAIAVALLGTLVLAGGLAYLGISIISRSGNDFISQTGQALERLRDLLENGPLHISPDQIDGLIGAANDWLQANRQVLLSSAATLGSVVGHLFTGTLLALFATLFFLIDGERIWKWVLRFVPASVRRVVHDAGAAGWLSLSRFVRVQILVAAIDAVGIGLGAWILGVPYALPLAILVFLGSFIPIVGAVLTGALAVFVALIYLGPLPALWMLLVVLAVQQIEGHVLQPLIMGTAVKVHPLAVVLAVASGSYLAGVAGALFAVPVVAFANTFIGNLARANAEAKPDRENMPSANLGRKKGVR